MSSDISRRQQQILDFIKEEIRDKGYPPSVREIGNAVGLSSTSTVHSHLEQLERKEFIRRDPTKPRAIEVLAQRELRTHPTVMVPLLGRVTAGQPITAVENIEETYPLPTDFAGGGDVFMLTVRGDSMIDAGILDGDYVLVRKQESARNGDIVVALLDDEEATVKRFYREKDHIRLQPENPYMEPILHREVKILGQVIGLFRHI